ncbi:MAG: hypothetical protein NTX25_20805 [Proteobacteria bacterium]|nr:hypothetical protein [Pseudomonadota bacterium]
MLNKFLAFGVALGFVGLNSSLGQAETSSEPATIRLSHSILRQGSSKSESKLDDGPTAKLEMQSLETFPAGIEIASFVKGYAIYVYPVTTGASLWFGKSLGTSMELGLTASLNSKNVKDGSEAASHSFGAYAWYTFPLSSSVNFEVNFNPAYILGSSKTIDTVSGASVTIKESTSGFSLYLDALAIIPIAKNFEYGFGFDYSQSRKETKKKTDDASTTSKLSDSSFGIVLAKFRYFI